MGPLPNGLINGFYMGVILTTYDSWDDPPSKSLLNSDSLWPGLRMRSLPFILDLDESNVRKVYAAVCRSG